MYLYLRADMPIEDLPEPLLKATGRLEFSFDLSLTAEKKLAREDAAAVMKNLQSQGYHLQLPPPDTVGFVQDERLPSSLDVG